MSRLTELVRRVEQQNPALAQELAQEIKTLTARRSFGLNFERHLPERVELPERTIRRGDKVRFRAPRDASGAEVDQRIWRVTRIEGRGAPRTAHLIELYGNGEPERAERLTADLFVRQSLPSVPTLPSLRGGVVWQGCPREPSPRPSSVLALTPNPCLPDSLQNSSAKRKERP